eukprot:TRINITY_DN14077_c0_g1_i1.p1 TRINITY_DN14077_c0_g1~~TRINITY_DN14077_c0_g1_i1.p1  ORF type:complete len:151 (+),score=23.00 TRINITY_DN14077_c0_g1_i1:3-455(+)
MKLVSALAVVNFVVGTFCLLLVVQNVILFVSWSKSSLDAKIAFACLRIQLILSAILCLLSICWWPEYMANMFGFLCGTVGRGFFLALLGLIVLYTSIGLNDAPWVLTMISGYGVIGVGALSVAFGASTKCTKAAEPARTAESLDETLLHE